jgi:hypothetical protein
MNRIRFLDIKTKRQRGKTTINTGNKLTKLGTYTEMFKYVK